VTKVMTLLEAAAKFHAVSRDMQVVGPAIVAHACEMVCTEAKRAIGTYDYGWQPLSPRRLSIRTPTRRCWRPERCSARSSGSQRAMKATSVRTTTRWQELGTSHIPPRSFLAQAAIRMEPKIHELAGRAVVSVMGGSGLHGPELGEIFHLLKHAAHDLKQGAEEFMEEKRDEDRRGRQR
jgi:hypothetical protein